MSEDVFEGRAVWSSKTNHIESAWVRIDEMGDARVSLTINRKGYQQEAASLTVAQARRLADHLYELARRSEERAA